MLLYDGRNTDELNDVATLQELIDLFSQAMNNQPNGTPEEQENYEDAMHSYARQRTACQQRLEAIKKA